jgi:2,3-bisphosphoglycerate-dependent phosphoglycerate mutase
MNEMPEQSHGGGARLSRRSLVAGGLGAAAWSSVASAMPINGFEIWFVRHGESQINVAVPPGTLREPDEGIRHPLTRTGIRQVLNMSAALASSGPSAILASTRLRALQTADAISFATLVPIVPAPQIVEVAVGEPTTFGPQSFDELYRNWLLDDNRDARMGGGESAAQVEKRALPFLLAQIERYRALAQPLIFVTHGALIALVSKYLFDNIDGIFAHAHPVANAGIVRAVPRGSRFHCTSWSGKAL